MPGLGLDVPRHLNTYSFLLLLFYISPELYLIHFSSSLISSLLSFQMFSLLYLYYQFCCVSLEVQLPCLYFISFNSGPDHPPGQPGDQQKFLAQMPWDQENFMWRMPPWRPDTQKYHFPSYYISKSSRFLSNATQMPGGPRKNLRSKGLRAGNIFEQISWGLPEDGQVKS